MLMFFWPAVSIMFITEKTEMQKIINFKLKVKIILKQFVESIAFFLNVLNFIEIK